jgi:quercetin dioxygenase-like cupin family protein
MTTKGPAEHFTGDVWMDQLGATDNTTVLSVHFTPGARTAWHSHPHGQVLHVTEGAGFVHPHGGTRELIRAGDTVQVKAGELHWHGATQDSFLTHLAVQESVTQWGDHVTDEEYDAPDIR